jgi:glycosyltransferase involved in cell wall biosynthesis
MRHFFILVPSLHPTGPVKGAYALANALVRERPVSLVALKAGPGVNAPLDEQVGVVELFRKNSNWLCLRSAYQSLLRQAGGRRAVASISMCFSADVVNHGCRREAVICASVRGNLMVNYRFDYGWFGALLALAHLRILSGFDHVAAMTKSMASQITWHNGCAPVVIGNCVDEPVIDSFRSPAGLEISPLRFVFVGSLSPRKQPLLLLQAINDLVFQGVKVSLDIIGDGQMRGQVEAEVRRRGLSGVVKLHGHLRDPFPIVARAHAFVLPSFSEGVSRAGLEALHLGVPCVLRNADGNAEVVTSGVNGVLFDENRELPLAMIQAAELAIKIGQDRKSLLPFFCRREEAAHCFIKLLEEGDG